MGFNQPADEVTAFTEELLRASLTLSDVMGELVEGLPADAYPGEHPGAVIVEMVFGTIRTVLEGTDRDSLESATQLIAAACARVLEHLRLALELSRRMDPAPDGRSRRNYG